MTTSDVPDRPLLSWETRIGVLGNGQLWMTMLMVFGISSGLLGVLVGFISKNLLNALLVPLVGTGGFMVAA